MTPASYDILKAAEGQLTDSKFFQTGEAADPLDVLRRLSAALDYRARCDAGILYHSAPGGLQSARAAWLCEAAQIEAKIREMIPKAKQLIARLEFELAPDADSHPPQPRHQQPQRSE